jgi:hypothetical protein
MSYNLVFVTAQPDVPYFHWQSKIYCHNFIEQGIKPEQIHIIFGIVDGKTEPSKESLELKSIGVNVHHYMDERHQKHYIPNIKPFLVSKWIKDYPELGKCFFLHDADIIFRELPNFEELLSDDISYLSDTKGYIGYDYINSCCERYEKQYPNSDKGQLIQEMVDVIGVDVECVKCNQDNSGGGQYIIKNTDHFIWNKIYEDCTPLYDQMMSYQRRFPISPGEIQFWTAEMWSLLWNLWLFGVETKITDELSFSWATDSVRIYEKYPILHMAGVTHDLKTTKFYKGEFINVNPLDKLKENINYFNYVDSDSSTIKYVDIMKRIVENHF